MDRKRMVLTGIAAVVVIAAAAGIVLAVSPAARKRSNGRGARAAMRKPRSITMP